jgi:hypothetical protein
MEQTMERLLPNIENQAEMLVIQEKMKAYNKKIGHLTRGERLAKRNDFLPRKGGSHGFVGR